MVYFIVFLIICLLVLILYFKLSAGVCKNKNSMEGKVIIVTGANSGIGFETARELAARGGRIILACRNVEKGQEAVKKIINSTKNSNVCIKQINLASLNSVRKFADEINSTEKRLDVLIHNSGVYCTGLKFTEDSLEEQFATNYFGPFLLNHLLLDLLKRSAPSRIIVVSSFAYRTSNLDLENMNCEKHINSTFLTYSNTKLANILFVHELSKKLNGTGVTANSLHPGLVKTGIFRNTPWYTKFIILPIIYPFLKDPKSGAQTTIYLATDDSVRDTSGKYFADCKPAWILPGARDDIKSKELWGKSEILTKIK
nr:retinol dehydrogenase 12-like [Parasteatoda tepidariorum]